MTTPEEPISPKQFLALVGDKTNEIKQELAKLIKSDRDHRVLTVKNDYYRADIGVQQFDDIKHVIEAAAHEKVFPAVFIQYKESLDLPKLAKDISTNENLDIDMKVLVVKSAKNVDISKLESWATESFFEVVYLESTEEQISNAKSINEKIGYDRLVEILNICNWPLRFNNLKPASGNAQLDRILRLVSEMAEDEGQMKFDFPLTGNHADSMFDEFLNARGFNVECTSTTRTMPQFTPEPQHAERVHLSPDSATTENDLCSQEDVTVTAEFDLCRLKAAREQAASQVAGIAEEISASVGKKKKKKAKGKKDE